MNLIAAADERWGIGRQGKLLAHLPGDMKYFRETTAGKVVVMGRKTLESFPGQKPLKNRVNIVLTGNLQYRPEGVEVCHSVEETLQVLKQYRPEDVFIIGGGMIYEAFLPWCSRAYVTRIHSVFEADTALPNLDRMEDWVCAKEGPMMKDGDVSYQFCIYERKGDKQV